jgi:hypothetical protein
MNEPDLGPEAVGRCIAHALTLLDCLGKDGVPSEDCFGTARLGLVLVGLDRVETDFVRSFREWLAAQPPATPDPALPINRYAALAGTPARLIYVRVLWDDVVKTVTHGDLVFPLLWAALDRVEAERLLAPFDAA